GHPYTQPPALLSAAPLLSPRQWKSADPQDRDSLPNFSPIRQESALDRLRMDPLLIKQYRDELSTEIDEKTGLKIEEKRPGQISDAVQQPFETPQNDPQRQRINNALTDKPLPGEVRVEGTSFRRVLLPPSAPPPPPPNNSFPSSAPPSSTPTPSKSLRSPPAFSPPAWPSSSRLPKTS